VAASAVAGPAAHAACAFARKLIAHGRDAAVSYLDVDADGLDARDEAEGTRRAQHARQPTHQRHQQEEGREDGEEEHCRLAPAVQQRRRRHARVARGDGVVGEEASGGGEQRVKDDEEDEVHEGRQ